MKEKQSSSLLKYFLKYHFGFCSKLIPNDLNFFNFSMNFNLKLLITKEIKLNSINYKNIKIIIKRLNNFKLFLIVFRYI